MMITLIKLYYFLEATSAASFSEAAKRLYTTQPNISKQISLLEKELDTELFIRNKGQISLTRAGQYLYNELKDLPDKVEQTCREAAAIGREDRNKLSIGIFKKAAGYELHMALLRFAEKEQELTFVIEREEYSDLCSGLLQQIYDMIITDEAELPVFRGNFEKRKLYDAPLAVAVSTKNPLSARESISMRELMNEPFIIKSPKGSGFCSDQLQKLFQMAGFTPKVARYVSSTENLFIYTGLNEGVAIIEENHGMLSSPQMKLVRFDPPVYLPIYALWSDRRGDGLPARMADWLISEHHD
jgi:DNA-binding transcriptional LysR family regulator